MQTTARTMMKTIIIAVRRAPPNAPPIIAGKKSNDEITSSKTLTHTHNIHVPVLCDCRGGAVVVGFIDSITDEDLMLFVTRDVVIEARLFGTGVEVDLAVCPPTEEDLVGGALAPSV